MVPGSQTCFGQRPEGTVEGGQEKVMGNGLSLLTFVGVLVDEGREVEVVSDFPEGGDGGGVTNGSLDGFGSLLQACEEVVGLAKVCQDDRARLAVDPAAVDELPVDMSAHGLFLEAGHILSVYISCAGGKVQLR
jgi:hypothetical protein